MLVRCCDNEPRECINVARFLSKLDEFLHANDMLGAERCLRYWADEARGMDDKRGLLIVTNEQIGFYRRQRQTDKATEACYAALKLLDETGLRHSVSGETVVVNVATALGAYGQTDLAAKLYDEAEQTFVAEGKQNTYEYAAFLNNKASTLYTMGKLDLAEDCLHRAVAVLTKPVYNGVFRTRNKQISHKLRTVCLVTHRRNATLHVKLAAILRSCAVMLQAQCNFGKG